MSWPLDALCTWRTTDRGDVAVPPSVCGPTLREVDVLVVHEQSFIERTDVVEVRPREAGRRRRTTRRRRSARRSDRHRARGSRGRRRTRRPPDRSRVVDHVDWRPRCFERRYQEGSVATATECVVDRTGRAQLHRACRGPADRRRSTRVPSPGTSTGGDLARPLGAEIVGGGFGAPEPVGEPRARPRVVAIDTRCRRSERRGRRGSPESVDV